MHFATLLFKNLLRRKTRSLLTCCGVAIAVGTTVVLLGITDSFERATVHAFEGRGVDLVVIEEGVIDQLSSDLDEKMVQRVARLPEVKDVAPGLLDLAAFPALGSTVTALVQGWEVQGFLLQGLKITSGQGLTEPNQHAAIIGKGLADSLQKQPGDSLEIEGETFEIVGIFESFTPAENSGVVIPLPQMQRIKYRPERVTGFSVVVRQDGGDTAAVDRVRRQISKLVDEQGKSGRMVAQPVRDYVQASGHIRIAHAMAWMTSVIAIVVGAIGMLNTMIMSVVERVREISILRAIGWKKSRVIRMILGESLIISMVGATLGSLGAIVLSQGLARWPAVQGMIDGSIGPPIVAMGFLMSTLLGLVGGVYPALRAARLLPAEGLRHE